MRSDDTYTLANNIAKDIDGLRPFDCNMIAMLTAQAIAEGKSKCELQNVCAFLQLLLLAVKTYMNC